MIKDWYLRISLKVNIGRFRNKEENESSKGILDRVWPWEIIIFFSGVLIGIKAF